VAQLSWALKKNKEITKKEKNLQDTLYKTTIAFAGMLQAMCLVRELAQTGKINDSAFEASIYSIFQTDPDTLEDIFGGITGIKLGLENLIHLFSPNAKMTRPLMHYTLSLLHLQKKISRSPKILQTLIQRINQIQKQVDYFHLTHPTVITNLAEAYLTAINPFKFRIIIWGSQRALSVTSNMDKIRALLLAGIRSAVLWRQMGGSRWQLLFSRGQIKAIAEKILIEIEQNQIK